MATITSVDPTVGPDDGGTQVTATGSGFVGTEPPEVRVGGVRSNSVTVNSDTELVFIAPMHVEVSPTVGPFDTEITLTITGAGFSPGDSFSVNGVEASNIVVVDGRTITGSVTTGPSEAQVDVVVTRSGESFTFVDGFGYAGNLSMSFWESRLGSSIISVEAFVVDASGNILETIWQESGDLGEDTWFERSLEYINPGVTHRIAWREVNGADFTGDWALDNITIDGQNFSFDADEDGFLTPSGLDTSDPVAALGDAILVPTATSAVLGRWNRNSGTTGSSGTGPSGAQNGTHYVYTETSSPNNGGGVNMWLFSPEITP